MLLSPLRRQALAFFEGDRDPDWQLGPQDLVFDFQLLDLPSKFFLSIASNYEQERPIDRIHQRREARPQTVAGLEENTIFAPLVGIILAVQQLFAGWGRDCRADFRELVSG